MAMKALHRSKQQAVVKSLMSRASEAMSLLLAMCGVPVDTKKTPYVSEEASSPAASCAIASASQ